jgi:putative addiction module component (TIGR02574 family)
MRLATDILDQVFALSREDRAELVRKLILSLEVDEFETDSEEQWAREIERRSNSIDDGTAVVSDWRDVVARMRATLRSRTQL